MAFTLVLHYMLVMGKLPIWFSSCFCRFFPCYPFGYVVTMKLVFCLFPFLSFQMDVLLHVKDDCITNFQFYLVFILIIAQLIHFLNIFRHKTRLHISQLVKDTSAKLKQASETDHDTEVSVSAAYISFMFYSSWFKMALSYSLLLILVVSMCCFVKFHV